MNRRLTDRRTQFSSAQNNQDEIMKNEADRPLTAFIEKILLEGLAPLGATTKPTIRVFSNSDPAAAQALEKLLNATEHELTYGEQLIGYDPDKKYDPALAEMLQNFADSIDILDNCKGTTPPAIRATETAIGHIQTACFWAQNAMAVSKL